VADLQITDPALAAAQATFRTAGDRLSPVVRALSGLDTEVVGADPLAETLQDAQELVGADLGITDTARHLIAQAQTDVVDLVTLSALELCVLDGPRHPVFDTRVAQAWTRVTERRRRKVTEEITASLVRRGLLIDGAPQHPTVQPGGNYSFKPELGLMYSFKPELGLMLAARCRPAFVVLAKGERDDLRPFNLFALGDQADPTRAIVAELPTALPPDRAARYPDTRKLGPLGWIYRYVLVSTADAADLLARWTMTPPAQPGEAAPVPYLVSAYSPDRQDPAGYHLRVRGDGIQALVDGPGIDSAQPAQHDLEQLRGFMLDLLARASR
jgi:hypothetical protein